MTDAVLRPYLRELPNGYFEVVYPADWPMPPGPVRPHIVTRRDAFVAMRGGMKVQLLEVPPERAIE